MPTKVVKATAEDFPRVFDPLLRRLNPTFSEERWRTLFAPGWENPEDHIGYALETESGRLVGFVATIYSAQRFPRKGSGVVCNVSSWIVDPGFRSSALALIMPLLRRRDLTVTNLTSLPEVNVMFRKLGFTTLETHTRILLPLPRPRRAIQVECSRVEPGRTEPSVDEYTARVIMDHRKVQQQWILREDNGTCHVILTLGRRRRMRTARIHHISNPEVFRRGIWSLRRQLFNHHRALLCEWDERLLGGLQISSTRRIPLPVSRLFRSTQIEAEDLSNLYSELPLLNL